MSRDNPMRRDTATLLVLPLWEYLRAKTLKRTLFFLRLSLFQTVFIYIYILLFLFIYLFIYVEI